MKKILRVPYEPNINQLPNILPRAGFRPLSEVTEDNLPVGSAIIIYDTNSNSLSPVVIINHYVNGRGFCCIHYGRGKKSYDEYDDYDIHLYKARLKGKYYKKLFCLPIVDFKPQYDFAPELVKSTGFLPLSTATSEDLPQGSVVLLYDVKNECITPVIARVLSMSNRRFLYFRQSHIDNAWEPNVIMGHLKPLENYLYMVIS